MSIATLIPLLIKISIMLAVFSIGLNATFSDTTYFLRRPGQLARAMVSMNVVMPIFALLICVAFDLHPAVKIALVVLAVSPVPPILPNKQLKAGGSHDYTVSLLVTSALLSVVMIPVTIAILQRLVVVEMSMSAGAVLKIVLSSIIIPLIIGILFRVASSETAQRIAKPVGIVSMVILAICIVPVLLVSTRSFITIVGDGTLAALASFAIVGLIVGHLLGGPNSENRPALALATASRHPAIALAIAHADFPDQKLVGPCVLVYLVLSAILAAPYLNWNKRTRVAASAQRKHIEV